jgi:Protein of unknown function (DUF433)
MGWRKRSWPGTPPGQQRDCEVKGIAGMSPEAIVADHPRLMLEDIRAAQTFAADHLADEAPVYG